MTQPNFRRARSEENKRQRAATIVEAARSLALEAGVASVTLTGVANRAGVHHSAVRRYFSSHKEVLLRLATEGMAELSDSVCATLNGPGERSPADVGAALSGALIAAPLFCDLLGSQYLHLEHEVEIDHVREAQRANQAAAMTIVDAIERSTPELDRKSALDIVTSAFALAGMLWQFTHPPEGLEHDFAEEPGFPDDWDTDFGSTLTRLLAATCIGYVKEP
ncbi:TetR family transcriptional regulator [Mycobacteroides sp. LB1]|uniref:TetR family transcriptional regulator n=1 Tax=Mycobacteroides sp. LB1 TaxID=2750814 RepID=UPI0015DFD6A2|nr:TetR family transcriptional regulator [Mycobacteroides sp. LB1]